MCCQHPLPERTAKAVMKVAAEGVEVWQALSRGNLGGAANGCCLRGYVIVQNNEDSARVSHIRSPDSLSNVDTPQPTPIRFNKASSRL